MKVFSLENRPDNMKEYRQETTVWLSWQTEPFLVDTQEGRMEISPETVRNWNDGYYSDGYYVAYPSDGSKPYAISKGFVEKNYVEV